MCVSRVPVVPGRSGRAAALVVVLLLGGCYGASEDETSVQPSTGGDSRRGIELIQQFGCGLCHTIPGVSGAEGVVAAPLNRLGRRVYIAGILRNTPENLMIWLQMPQRIVPGNAMPDMGLNERQARDIAAYLYTLQ
jgi:cytochrome c2